MIGGGSQGEGLGGFGAESGEGVEVDASGNAYVVGSTNTIAATPYPIKGAFQSTPGAAGSNIDAVVTKVNPSGSDIVYSTYLGGGGADRAFSVAVSPNGEAFVTGQTDSSGATPFPTRNPIQAAFGGGTGTGTARSTS